ncbi:hypothetical protein [Paracoccus yeei]|uniref:hypothetical protein n=1 Tax=Paracoccus yeei TaxID=147645 RepID=UPI00174A6B20|nr:hypothetical protein [Paracoccus yeei]
MEAHLIPNWTSGVRETYEFKTSVFTSDSGKEQRSALRMTPRRRVEFSSLLTETALRHFYAMMHNRRADVLTIPDPARRGMILTRRAPAGSTTLHVDSIPPWMAVGIMIALSTFDRTEEAQAASTASVGSFSQAFSSAFDIAAVGSGTIVLTNPLTVPWPEGSEIRPVIRGRLPESVSLQHHTDTSATVSVSFDLLNPTQMPILGGSAPRTFANREVLLARPNWIAPPSVELSSPIETVDYGRGITASFRSIDFFTRITQFTYSDRDVGDISSIIGIFHRMKGRRGEFWSPSWTTDFLPAGPIIAGSTTFTVQDATLAADYSGSTVNRAIAILKSDGEWILRQVTGMTIANAVAGGAFASAYDASFDSAPASGNRYTRFTVSQEFGQTVPTTDIEMVCWLNVCRFASDTLTVEWLTDQVARTVLNVMTLENLPAET